MRKLIAVVGLVLAAGWTVAGADDDAAKAAKKLEGTYEVVSATRGGKPDEKAKDVKAFVIKDGVITIKTDRKDEPAKFTLDPAKAPGHIDLRPERGKEMAQGIYRTKETDAGLELSIAFARGGGERPKDFKGAGENEVSLKLLRKKAK